MRLYFEYIINTFKEYLAYRVAFFTGIAQRLLALVAQLYLWQALMGQSGQTSSSEGIVTLGDMTTYVFISTLISSLLIRDIVMDINDKVRNGQITSDLIKPINFTAYMFCRMLSGSLYTLIFQLLPVLLVGLFFLDIRLPAPQDFIFFCIAVINAIVIMFFISFGLGILSFWYTSMWQVEQLLGAAIELFSGRWIPVWFFPGFLVSMSAFLPFKLMFYMPISIYLGKVSTADCWYTLLQQVMWIVILYGLTRLMWHAAVKKLVIQGG